MANAEKDDRDRSTILVVDGHVLVRMAIADYLRGCGYKVLEAADAAEATALLDHEEMSIQVLLADVGLNGSTDAFALAQWARERRPGLHVLLAGTPARAVETAASLCDEAPLKRPYEPQVVHDRIKRLLAREQGVDRPVGRTTSESPI